MAYFSAIAETERRIAEQALHLAQPGDHTIRFYPYTGDDIARLVENPDFIFSLGLDATEYDDEPSRLSMRDSAKILSGETTKLDGRRYRWHRTGGRKPKAVR